MLAWCREEVSTAFGTVVVDHWAVPDSSADDHDDFPELDSAQDQLGAVLWNSNACVSQYLADKVFAAGAVSGMNVLELGAGVGCLGISLASAGARVAITDIKELVPLMKHNINLNKFPAPGCCKAFAWKWGEAAPAELMSMLGRRLDVVLLCDALYGNPKDWPKLVATLDLITDNFPSCTILNFCEQRVNAVESGFIELITQKGQNSEKIWQAETSDIQGTSDLAMRIKATKFSRGTKEHLKKKRRVEA